MNTVNNNQRDFWLSLLIGVLILRIGSYFMISESATVTRIFKVGTRVILTGWTWWLFSKSRKKIGISFSLHQAPALFFYCLYLLTGFASLLWTSSLSYSSLQLIMDLECLVFCIFFWKLYLWVQVSQPERIRFSHLLWVAVALIGVIFLLGMFVDPDAFYRKTHGGTVARLGGFIINPNELGMLYVVGVACLYADMTESKRSIWHILGLLVMVIGLVLTGSRSSMISFFGVSGYFVMIAGSFQLKLGAILGSIGAIPVVIQKIFIKEGDVGEVMSMTGRLPFWSDLLTYGFPKRPWLGFGFMRISETDTFESLHAYDGAMTHNTFLQVLLNLGLIGASIVLLQLIFSVRAFIAQKDVAIKRLALGIFIPIFVNSLTEFGIFGETNYGIMFYLFTLLALSLSRKDPAS